MSRPNLTPYFPIFELDIIPELWRIQKKWGVERRKPDGNKHDVDYHRAKAEMWQWMNDNTEATWQSVLSEEFHEALAETDPTRLREELVQVIAVAFDWIRDLDNRASVPAKLPTVLDELKAVVDRPLSDDEESDALDYHVTYGVGGVEAEQAEMNEAEELVPA